MASVSLAWRDNVLGSIPIVEQFPPDTDLTPLLQARFASAEGGTMHVHGRGRLYDRLVIPAGWGFESTGTVPPFVAAHADAQIAVGTYEESARQGGTVGNFEIDGNGIATCPLLIGRFANRLLVNIHSHSAADVAMMVEATQNSTIIGYEAAQSPRGLVVDAGAKNLWIIGGTINDCQRSLSVQMTRLHPVNPDTIKRPSMIHFWGGVWETNIAGGVNVEISAAAQVSFSKINMNPAPSTINLRVVRQSGTGMPTPWMASKILLDQCDLSGGSIGLDLVGETGDSRLVEVELDHWSTIGGMSEAAIRSDRQGRITLSPSTHIAAPAGVPQFVGVSGATETDVVRRVTTVAGFG